MKREVFILAHLIFKKTNYVFGECLKLAWKIIKENIPFKNIWVGSKDVRMYLQDNTFIDVSGILKTEREYYVPDCHFTKMTENNKYKIYRYLENLKHVVSHSFCKTTQQEYVKRNTDRLKMMTPVFLKIDTLLKNTSRYRSVNAVDYQNLRFEINEILKVIADCKLTPGIFLKG